MTLCAKTSTMYAHCYLKGTKLKNAVEIKKKNITETPHMRGEECLLSRLCIGNILDFYFGHTSFKSQPYTDRVFCGFPQNLWKNPGMIPHFHCDRILTN